MIKILIPTVLLIIGFLNTKYQDEKIVSAKEYKEFQEKHATITNIVAEKQRKFFSYRKFPKGDKETIYLTKEDIKNLEK